MVNMKKQHLVLIIIVIILIVGFLSMSSRKSRYSLADLGVSPLLQTDCSLVKDSGNSPVTISFNAPQVPSLHEKVKELVKKYNGHITSDSLYSYATGDPSIPSEDSATVIATFDTKREEFLAEMSTLMKNSGGVNTNYSYSDGTDYGVYSPYTSCTSMLQTVWSDALQLEILTKALKREDRTRNIALLSQGSLQC